MTLRAGLLSLFGLLFLISACQKSSSGGGGTGSGPEAVQVLSNGYAFSGVTVEIQPHRAVSNRIDYVTLKANSAPSDQSPAPWQTKNRIELLKTFKNSLIEKLTPQEKTSQMSCEVNKQLIYDRAQTLSVQILLNGLRMLAIQNGESRVETISATTTLDIAEICGDWRMPNKENESPETPATPPPANIPEEGKN